MSASVTGTHDAGASAATDPGGPTGGLATWLAGLEPADVPVHVQERAKHILLDGIGCALVGAQLPWSRTAVEAVLAMEDGGPATLIGWDTTTSAAAAALLNGTFIQGFELDDVHTGAPQHCCSLVIPAVLATAELGGPLDGRRLLTAAIAGFEAGPRVGRALHGPQMLSRGWHSGAVFGAHAAAAASAVLRGLDAARTEHALGLAATQSAGLMAAQFEAMSKRMQHGFAARNGFYAAGLAAAGYTGIKRVYEREYGGFLAVFGEGHDPRPDEVHAELGQRWETTGIVIKPYAAMLGLHAAVDGVRALVAHEAIPVGAITRIDIALGEAVYHHGWWPPQRPLTETGAQMNIGYAVAVALLDGTVLPQQFTRARLDSDDVWDLIERVHVQHDETIDLLEPEHFTLTRLRVTLADGTQRSIEVPQARGGLADPLSNAEIIERFRALTGAVVSAPRGKAIEDAVLRLDQLRDVRELTVHLTGQVAGVLD